MPYVKGTNAVVNPDVLRWAIGRAQKSEEELSSTFPNITGWLRDEGEISVNKLQALSKRLHVPFGLLLSYQVPERADELPQFRTLNGKAISEVIPALRDQISLLKRRQDWIVEHLEVELGFEPLPFVSKYQAQRPSAEELAHEIALTFRFDFEQARLSGTADGLVRHIVQQTEANGVFVSITGVVGTNNRLALPVDACRGFVLNHPVAPFVYINATDSKTAQVFTLMHEIAHIWLGESLLMDDSDIDEMTADELFCNQVAVELLTPAAIFDYQWQLYDGDVSKIARKLCVSEPLIARRAKELGYLTTSQLKEFFNNYYKRIESRAEAPKASGGDFYASRQVATGRRFLKIVNEAVKAGHLRFTDAYQLTGVKGKTYQTLMDKIS